MKRSSAVLLLLIIGLVPLMLGMGSRSGSSPERIPIPSLKFTATFIDQVDIITECSDVSVEGETFLQGKRGKGTYAISFSKISSVVFTVQEEKLIASIKLRDGETTELTVNRMHKAYGRTKTGSFQILLLDLKKMIISKAVK